MLEWTLDLGKSPPGLLEVPRLEDDASDELIAARTLNTCVKVRDEGTYALLTADGIILSEIRGYVPWFFPEQHFGDYLELVVNACGDVENWTVPADKVVREMKLLEVNNSNHDTGEQAYVLEKRAPELYEKVRGNNGRLTAAYHMVSNHTNYAFTAEDRSAYEKSTHA